MNGSMTKSDSGEHFAMNLISRPLTQDEVQTGKEQLLTDGICMISRFLSKDIIDRCVGVLDRLSSTEFRKESESTIYLTSPDISLPEDHPLRATVRNQLGTLAADQLPMNFPLYELYQCEDFLDLISTLVGKPLFRLADPLGCINVLSFRDGDELGWHFDEPEFSVTVLLQEASRGGVFEYFPPEVLTDRMDFDAVRYQLSQTDANASVAPIEPGTLLLIRGNNILHRVSAVGGPTPRYIGVLSFSENPTTILTDHDRVLFYGRSGRNSAAG